nr:MAG TPA: hypothetical protein [Caudoviricetes sp.]
MMRHIENIPIVGLASCFTTLTRKTRNARLQAMSAMAGFWDVCIFTTRKNKLLKHGTGGLTMAKAVLISIRPEWVEKIARGEKTVEVRKTRPKLEAPFKCYVYRTKGTVPHIINGKWVQMEVGGTIIAEFTCDRVETIKAATEPYGIYDVDDDFVAQTRLVDGALWDYGKGATLYGWHISKLQIYDTPKPLSAFKGLCKIDVGCGECPYYNYTKMECDGRTIKRLPQSWCYVEELK